MSKKDMKEADLPATDNLSQNSQLANSIRNQSVVSPEDYPLEQRSPEKTTPDGGDRKGSGQGRPEGKED